MDLLGFKTAASGHNVLGHCVHVSHPHAHFLHPVRQEQVLHGSRFVSSRELSDCPGIRIKSWSYRSQQKRCAFARARAHHWPCSTYACGSPHLQPRGKVAALYTSSGSHKRTKRAHCFNWISTPQNQSKKLMRGTLCVTGFSSIAEIGTA